MKLDLSPKEVDTLLDALDLASQDLAYRIDELDDTGDYDKEDIANMELEAIEIDRIYFKIVKQYTLNPRTPESEEDAQAMTDAGFGDR